jgi:NADH:ubiquinone oxidoreductase subunit 2 (subunit N)
LSAQAVGKPTDLCPADLYSTDAGSKGKIKERTRRLLTHLPADSLAASSAMMAWIGALVLVVGEIAALISLPNLGRVFLISTVAELGYVLIGFGVGGPAGDTGALMHLGFQAVMRGLVLAAG